jgi:tRNA pseudouridine55 synthase
MSRASRPSAGDTCKTDSQASGEIILIDKPANCSSARAVNLIKKKLRVGKAGHSGTLDPMATGLLIVCTGRTTKLLSSLISSDKQYEGIMILGASTRSYDAESKIVESKPIKGISYSNILKAADFFMGEIEQLPPMFSAIKYKGKPLYKYARKGEEVERKARKVRIDEFKILSVELPEISFRISCSKGTYIRSLVHDFGQLLGVGAYLKELRRTRIGEYSIKEAIPLDDFLKTDSNLLHECL